MGSRVKPKRPKILDLLILIEVMDRFIAKWKIIEAEVLLLKTEMLACLIEKIDEKDPIDAQIDAAISKFFTTVNKNKNEQDSKKTNAYIFWERLYNDAKKFSFKRQTEKQPTSLLGASKAPRFLGFEDPSEESPKSNLEELFKEKYEVVQKLLFAQEDFVPFYIDNKDGKYNSFNLMNTQSSFKMVTLEPLWGYCETNLEQHDPFIKTNSNALLLSDLAKRIDKNNTKPFEDYKLWYKTTDNFSFIVLKCIHSMTFRYIFGSRVAFTVPLLVPESGIRAHTPTTTAKRRASVKDKIPLSGEEEVPHFEANYLAKSIFGGVVTVPILQTYEKESLKNPIYIGASSLIVLSKFIGIDDRYDISYIKEDFGGKTYFVAIKNKYEKDEFKNDENVTHIVYLNKEKENLNKDKIKLEKEIKELTNTAKDTPEGTAFLQILGESFKSNEKKLTENLAKIKKNIKEVDDKIAYLDKVKYVEKEKDNIIENENVLIKKYKLKNYLSFTYYKKIHEENNNFIFMILEMSIFFNKLYSIMEEKFEINDIEKKFKSKTNTKEFIKKIQRPVSVLLLKKNPFSKYNFIQKKKFQDFLQKWKDYNIDESFFINYFKDLSIKNQSINEMINLASYLEFKFSKKTELDIDEESKSNKKEFQKKYKNELSQLKELGIENIYCGDSFLRFNFICEDIINAVYKILNFKLIKSEKSDKTDNSEKIKKLYKIILILFKSITKDDLNLCFGNLSVIKLQSLENIISFIILSIPSHIRNLQFIFDDALSELQKKGACSNLAKINLLTKFFETYTVTKYPDDLATKCEDNLLELGLNTKLFHQAFIPVSVASSVSSSDSDEEINNRVYEIKKFDFFKGIANNGTNLLFSAHGCAGDKEEDKGRRTKSIADAIRNSNVQFNLLLGDNVYNNGIEEDTKAGIIKTLNEYYSQIYSPDNCNSINSFCILGNHDYSYWGRGTNNLKVGISRAQKQVDATYYSNNHDILKQDLYTSMGLKAVKNWYMPEKYYALLHKDTKTIIFMLDSSMFLFGEDECVAQQNWLSETYKKYVIDGVSESSTEPKTVYSNKILVMHHPAVTFGKRYDDDKVHLEVDKGEYEEGEGLGSQIWRFITSRFDHEYDLLLCAHDHFTDIREICGVGEKSKNKVTIQITSGSAGSQRWKPIYNTANNIVGSLSRKTNLRIGETKLNSEFEKLSHPFICETKEYTEDLAKIRAYINDQMNVFPIFRVEKDLIQFKMIPTEDNYQKLTYDTEFVARENNAERVKAIVVKINTHSIVSPIRKQYDKLKETYNIFVEVKHYHQEDKEKLLKQILIAINKINNEDDLLNFQLLLRETYLFHKSNKDLYSLVEDIFNYYIKLNNDESVKNENNYAELSKSQIYYENKLKILKNEFFSIESKLKKYHKDIITLILNPENNYKSKFDKADAEYKSRSNEFNSEIKNKDLVKELKDDFGITNIYYGDSVSKFKEVVSQIMYAIRFRVLNEFEKNKNTENNKIYITKLFRFLGLLYNNKLEFTEQIKESKNKEFFETKFEEIQTIIFDLIKYIELNNKTDSNLKDLRNKALVGVLPNFDQKVIIKSWSFLTDKKIEEISSFITKNEDKKTENSKEISESIANAMHSLELDPYLFDIKGEVEENTLSIPGKLSVYDKSIVPKKLYECIRAEKELEINYKLDHPNNNEFNLLNFFKYINIIYSSSEELSIKIEKINDIKKLIDKAYDRYQYPGINNESNKKYQKLFPNKSEFKILHNKKEKKCSEIVWAVDVFISIFYLKLLFSNYKNEYFKEEFELPEFIKVCFDSPTLEEKEKSSFYLDYYFNEEEENKKSKQKIDSLLGYKNGLEFIKSYNEGFLKISSEKEQKLKELAIVEYEKYLFNSIVKIQQNGLFSLSKDELNPILSNLFPIFIQKQFRGGNLKYCQEKHFIQSFKKISGNKNLKDLQAAKEDIIFCFKWINSFLVVDLTSEYTSLVLNLQTYLKRQIQFIYYFEKILNLYDIFNTILNGNSRYDPEQIKFIKNDFALKENYIVKTPIRYFRYFIWSIHSNYNQIFKGDDSFINKKEAFSEACSFLDLYINGKNNLEEFVEFLNKLVDENNGGVEVKKVFKTAAKEIIPNILYAFYDLRYMDASPLNNIDITKPLLAGDKNSIQLRYPYNETEKNAAILNIIAVLDSKLNDDSIQYNIIDKIEDKSILYSDVSNLIDDYDFYKALNSENISLIKKSVPMVVKGEIFKDTGTKGEQFEVISQRYAYEWCVKNLLFVKSSNQAEYLGYLSPETKQNEEKYTRKTFKITDFRFFNEMPFLPNSILRFSAHGCAGGVDFGGYNKRSAEIATAIKNKNIQFNLLLGDNIYDHGIQLSPNQISNDELRKKEITKQLTLFYSDIYWKNNKINSFCILGNHDYNFTGGFFNTKEKGFHIAFRQIEATEYGKGSDEIIDTVNCSQEQKALPGWHLLEQFYVLVHERANTVFFMLDSCDFILKDSHDKNRNEQICWLEKIYEQYKNVKYKILVMHHPALSFGKRYDHEHTHTDFPPEAYLEWFHANEAIGTQIWNYISHTLNQTYDVLFCAHDHYTDVRAILGHNNCVTLQITSGSAGHQRMGVPLLDEYNRPQHKNLDKNHPLNADSSLYNIDFNELNEKFLSQNVTIGKEPKNVFPVCDILKNGQMIIEMIDAKTGESLETIPVLSTKGINKYYGELADEYNIHIQAYIHDDDKTRIFIEVLKSIREIVLYKDQKEEQLFQLQFCLSKTSFAHKAANEFKVIRYIVACLFIYSRPYLVDFSQKNSTKIDINVKYSIISDSFKSESRINKSIEKFFDTYESLEQIRNVGKNKNLIITNLLIILINQYLRSLKINLENNSIGELITDIMKGIPKESSTNKLTFLLEDIIKSKTTTKLSKIDKAILKQIFIPLKSDEKNPGSFLNLDDFHAVINLQESILAEFEKIEDNNELIPSFLMQNLLALYHIVSLLKEDKTSEISQILANKFFNMSRSLSLPKDSSSLSTIPYSSIIPKKNPISALIRRNSFVDISKEYKDAEDVLQSKEYILSHLDSSYKPVQADYDNSLTLLFNFLKSGISPKTDDYRVINGVLKNLSKYQYESHNEFCLRKVIYKELLKRKVGPFSELNKLPREGEEYNAQLVLYCLEALQAIRRLKKTDVTAEQEKNIGFFAPRDLSVTEEVKIDKDDVKVFITKKVIPSLTGLKESLNLLQCDANKKDPNAIFFTINQNYVDVLNRFVEIYEKISDSEQSKQLKVIVPAIMHYLGYFKAKKIKFYEDELLADTKFEARKPKSNWGKVRKAAREFKKLPISTLALDTSDIELAFDSKDSSPESKNTSKVDSRNLEGLSKAEQFKTSLEALQRHLVEEYSILVGNSSVNHDPLLGALGSRTSSRKGG